MVNPDISELKNQVNTLTAELAALKAEVTHLRDAASANARQTVWQLVATVGSTCLILGTLMVAMVSSLEKRIDARFDTINQRFDGVNQRFEALEKRLELTERNMDKRFEDFKQEVRSIMRQSPQK
jgi:F0F1-type ATP synthase membrane subunit b/b'